MKKLLIVANWKMNKIKDEAKNYLEEFLPLVKDAKSDIVIAPSFALLDYMQAKLKGTGIELSSQNMFFAPTGAFTGEVSADMLKDFDVKYVILGHSERRQYFLETDSFINKKSYICFK